MSRINTNVPSLIAQRNLSKNNATLNTSLQRLSTGLRINSGADDPSGLIASESLKAEQVGIQAGLDNATRAGNIIGTAEGGLSEISALTNNLQSLVSQAANTGGLSNDEIAANQLQVDSILNTINRLAGSTSFEGQKLLDGSLDYKTSGVNASTITNVTVNGARIADGSTRGVSISVTASAETAAIAYTGGALTAAATIEVSGANGTEQLSFLSGATNSSIKDAINAVSETTGVTATLSGGNVALKSSEYGSKQFVTVKAVSGTFTTDKATDNGVDATVSVNGAAAQVDGLNVHLRTANLDVEFAIDEAQNATTTSTSFAITGGGATFSIGSKVTEQTKASLGISSVTTASLGNATLGFLSTLASGKENSLSSGNLTKAQRILDKAVNQISTLRGRLGAFQKFDIGSTVNSLGVALENTSAAQSAIADTDFATETAKLTRAQILSSASSTVLSQANTAPQSALSLLR